MSKKFNLDEYRETLKITKLIEKKPKYVELNEELQACIGLPGFPMGDISEIWGDSDTGKSTLIFHAAAQCQKQGILPVVIIKEKKHRDARVKMMGFDSSQAIMNLSCKSLEDMFEFTDQIIADVNKGKLPHDVMIFIDSTGNANCRAAITEDKKTGRSAPKNVHQQNAKVMSEWMMILSDKIGDTRYENSPHDIGLVFTNHIYSKPVQVGGKTFEKQQPRGGKKRKYVSSLEMSVKRMKGLEAIVDGNRIDFGFISKLSVVKNHINGIKNSGEFVITVEEIFANEKGAIQDYKDKHRHKWGNAEIIEVVGQE